LCPLCEYNLSGLTTARCPECGFQFTWAELLDAEKDRHVYLFEHGKKPSVKKLWKTYWQSCRPRRFWREVNPAQPVVLFRLLAYWIVATGIAILCVNLVNIRSVGSVVGTAVQLTQDSVAGRTFMMTRLRKDPRFSVLSKNQIQAMLVSYYPYPWQPQFWNRVMSASPYSQRWRHHDPSAFGWLGIFIAWPWLTLTSLFIFRLSMRQAKIRTVHLLRCVIYSCDFGLLFTVAFGAMMFMDNNLADGWLLVPALVLCAAVTTYRLTIAFGKYLRVHLPLATVLASQIISMLVVFTALIPMVDFSRQI
jgi:hypothetical protein